MSSEPSSHATSDTGRTNSPPINAVFATTHWSVVLSAGAKESPESSRALEILCRTYWYPLYAHVRRTGRNAQDAEDLTQAFFERLLEKEWLAAADRTRGRFRSFLLSSLKHYLANEWDRVSAQKRGGHVRILSLDAREAETRFHHEPADTTTPDRQFDRRWALTLLDTVLGRLQQEYADEGKAGLFEHLKGTLGGDRASAPYARIAGELGMSEGSVKVAVHRLRQRYRAMLRAEIAQTVATEADVEDELRHLFAALSG